MSGKIHKTEFEKMLEQKVAEEEKQKDSAGEEAQPVSAAAEPVQDEVEELRRQLLSQQAECEQLKDQQLRLRAEFDNYRKRMLRELDQARFSATANLIRLLLPVVDNLERALAHAEEEDGLAVGVRMVHKQLADLFAAEGLVPIEARGQVFDPNLHDALSMTPSEEVEAGIVLQEFERGYKLKDQVLRPAKVIVSAGKEADASGVDAGESKDETSPSSE
jgi:molecular chaperone GrpE